MMTKKFDFAWVCLILSFVFSSFALAGTVPEGKPLPAWETEQEKALRAKLGFPQPESTDDPPAGDVESYAEWAPSSGVIVSWMGFESFLTDMVAEFVQVGKSWIVVESTSQQTSVENDLVSEGIPLDNVEFLVFNMDTVWMVDYGPFFVNVDGEREIIDFRYDRFGRDYDDEFPENLGGAWNVPVYDGSELRIEGGNFIADGAGTCFITERVIEQNQPYLSEQEVYDRLESYCGCETIHVVDRINDGTGHIDMFAKLLDEDTMLVGQYDPGDPEYTTLENNATYIANQVASTGENYEVVRIPMPGAASAYWTYTNSIIVNDHVFVPVYNDPLDTEALQIYETAMPGYTIVPIDASSVIGSGGAVHCTTKVVPTAAMYQAGIADLILDDSSGDNDGYLDPGESVTMAISLVNQGIEMLTGVSGILSCQETQYVTITQSTGLWSDIPSGSSVTNSSPDFALSIDAMTPEDTELNFTLAVTADSYTTNIDFTLEVTSVGLLLNWNLSQDPGWTTEGDWAWGVPQGQDGDPSSGHTGDQVYGYNLAGDYSNNMSETSLISTAIDCSEIQNTEIRFMRWLGVESSSYDHASFEVSNNASSWTTVWEHSGSTLTESSWTQCSYDISSVADNQSTVYFKWVMGSSDSSVTYCGWNVDDIEIWGVSTITSTPTPVECINDGDVNLDGTVTAGDAQLAFYITLGTYTPTMEEECAADCNADEEVTAGDAQLIFQTALGSATCADAA